MQNLTAKRNQRLKQKRNRLKDIGKKKQKLVITSRDSEEGGAR